MASTRPGRVRSSWHGRSPWCNRPPPALPPIGHSLLAVTPLLSRLRAISGLPCRCPGTRCRGKHCHRCQSDRLGPGLGGRLISRLVLRRRPQALFDAARPPSEFRLCGRRLENPVPGDCRGTPVGPIAGLLVAMIRIRDLLGSRFLVGRQLGPRGLADRLPASCRRIRDSLLFLKRGT